MSQSKNIQFLILGLILGPSFGVRVDWELRQLTEIQNGFQYFEDKAFNSTEDVIKDARIVVKNWMNEKNRNLAGIPGAVFGFSVKGKTIWTEGFGYTDVENDVTTDKNSVWRLASISKSLTSALVAQLIDRGLLDLNKSIHEYLPKSVFPIKTFNGTEVDITLRQVLSHTAGLHLTELQDFDKVYEAFKTTESLNRLKDEKLLFRPGTEFSYSNYGFQVVGAIIESVLNNTYQNEMKNFYSNFKMNSTFAETREQIIKHRPRYYQAALSSDPLKYDLINAHIFDDLFSYEGWWPSGGMVSTVDDLLAFGNAMINAYKGKNKDFLSQSVVKELWTPETKGMVKLQDFGKNEYGKGWLVIDIKDLVPDYPYKTLVWHSGGLTGTSTLLFLFPEEELVGVAFSNVGSTLGMDNILLYVAKNLKDFI